MQNIITTHEPINRFPDSKVHSMGKFQVFGPSDYFQCKLFFQILDHLRGFVILEKVKQFFCPICQ